jgi:hypothetical protein
VVALAHRSARQAVPVIAQTLMSARVPHTRLGARTILGCIAVLSSTTSSPGWLHAEAAAEDDV